MELDGGVSEDGALIKSMLWRNDTMEPVTKVSQRVIRQTSGGSFADAADIRLEKDSLFEKSAQTGLSYVKSIDTDRLLAPSYEMHGLDAPNGAKRYGGWERMGASNWGASGGTFTLAGHSLGHWMSAAAVLYRETGDEELLQKLNYTVEKLDELQTKTGSPYIGGCEETTFKNMFAGKTNWAEGYWVPWYGIHKIYQGLIDTYYCTESDTSLKVAVKFADWACDGIAGLSDAFMQNALNVEYGGMNEIFALLHEITGEDKYLDAARRFTHDNILNPLIAGEDKLAGLHANTQIPKIIGAAEMYEQDPVRYADYKTACINFWNFVANNRSYAIGGNSIAEHFESEGAETLGVKTCESCNSYNMLRLTEHLYSWTHDQKYMDYYENILYNHLLGQQDPDTGAKMYFVSLLQGHHRIYEVKDESWWCCTGTGMENPGRYTRCAYYKDGGDMYVNLYMPTEVNWREKGLKFKVETSFPYSDKVRLTVTEGDAQAAFKFRAPSYLAKPMTARVNGEESVSHGAGGYMELARKWKAGDTAELTVPMAVTVYKSRFEGQIAYKYGPVTLAAELDSVEGANGVNEYVSNETKLDSAAIPVPYIITDGAAPETLVEKTDGTPLGFKISSKHSSDGKDIYLKPFYEIHHHFHNVYWDVDKPTGEYDKALNAVTLDKVQPDGQQDELGHGLKSEKSHCGSLVDAATNTTYFWRDAWGGEDAYFEYNMSVDGNTKYLFVRYWGKDVPFASGGVTYTRDFNIYVDGQLLTRQSINNNSSGIYDVFYEIPSDMTAGKSTVAVRLAPQSGTCCAGGCLEIRTTSAKVE